jgi:GT2 family glycosyltransferase
VTIIIVSWNTRELLVRCLTSCSQPTVKGNLRTEVIVVDNASSDGSAKVAHDMAGVNVIALAHNIGYGRANNLGMERGSGRYFLILNPDTIPLRGSIQTLVDFADRAPRAGIVAPRLLNDDRSVQTSAFKFPTLAMAAIDLFPLPGWMPGRLRARLLTSSLNGRYLIEQQANEPFCIEHPLGACMLIRREAYEECGGFDDNIFMYSEEIDLALRYARGGWQCWQVPQAEVIHLGGRSTSQAPVAMQRELWRSRLYIYRKYRSPLRYAALATLLLLAQLVAMLTVTLKRLLRVVPAHEAARQKRLARTLIKVALSK